MKTIQNLIKVCPFYIDNQMLRMSKKYYKFGLVALVALVLTVSCTVPPEKRVATEEVVEELESRKIIRLTDAEIVSGAREFGVELVTYLEKNTSDTTCGALSLTLPDSLAGLSEQLFFRCDTTESRLHPKERAVLAAYQTGAASGAPLDDNVQKLRDRKSILFTRPLLQQDSLIGMWSITMTRAAIIREVGHRREEAKKRRRRQ